MMQTVTTAEGVEEGAGRQGISKPVLFLICALAALIIGLSLIMPVDVPRRSSVVAMLPTPHREYAGRLGLVTDRERISAVLYPDAKVPVRPGAVVIIAGSGSSAEMVAGVIQQNPVLDANGKTCYRLGPVQEVQQHPVLALPREYVGVPAYYTTDPLVQGE